MHSGKDFPTVNALLGCFLIVNHVQNRSYADFPKVKLSAVAVEFDPIVNNAKSWASLDYPKAKSWGMVANRSEHWGSLDYRTMNSAELVVERTLVVVPCQ